MNDLRFKKRKIRRQVISVMSILLSTVMVLLGVLFKSNSILFIFISLLLLGIYLFIKSIRMVDSIIVNTNGIHSSIKGMELIEWKFIEDFEIKNGINTMILLIKVKDQEQLLNVVNKRSRRTMRKNIRKLGYPIVIPQSELHDSIDLVKDRLETYKNTL